MRGLMLMSNSKKAAKKNSGTVIKSIAALISILCIAGSIFLLMKFSEKAKKACDESFKIAYEKTKEDTYNDYKKLTYDYWEKNNHVSNRATLSIGNIKEENNLEVLSVSESWVKISEPDKDNDKTTRWVEFNATGLYTVDMSASEFIVDDYNNYIIVKLKTPQLSHISLDSNSKAYLFKYKKGFFELNGDYDSGVKMMLNDRSEALDKLTEQLESNDANLARAKKSTENLIRTFLKNVNPEMELKDSNIRIQFT